MIEVIRVPLDLEFRDPAKNLEKIESVLKKHTVESPVKSGNQRLFIFPELTLHGFSIRSPEKIALSEKDELIQVLKSLAKKYQAALVAGWIEASNEASVEKPKNALGFFNEEGQILGVYYKIHLFNRGNPAESDTFTAGASPCVVEWQGVKWGLSICYDLRFPRLYREYRLQNVDALICSACWVGGPHKALQFKTLSQAHAILNRAYFFSVNRSGRDPYYEYEGDTHAFDPTGESCKQMLNPELIQNARIHPLVESI